MIQVDRHTIIQILGSLMNNPFFLSDTDKYFLEPNDFSNPLDKFIFSAIYNLFINGAEKIHSVDIIEYLNNSNYAKQLIEESNGLQFLQDCENNAEINNYGYYYNKFKKINLIRDLQLTKNDIENFYTEDILNENYSEINKKFEEMTTADIINFYKIKFNNLENKYVLNETVKEGSAADNIRELVDSLKQKPETGCPLQGDIFNTITRGGRKGKLYLRSASSGIGKTRSMVGDAANIAYPLRYDTNIGQWICTGNCEKVLYIMTEQDPEEIKTMLLAYLTGYNEEIFLYGTFGEEEQERIDIAIEIMEKYKDNMLFAKIADPCSSVVKNLLRRYSLQYQVENFFYDYIFSSPAMLNEYRDLKIQEHVALRLFTTTLKNLAVELNAFILTSTQISNDDDDKGGFRDYHYVQGSKAIVNLVDFACIMSRPTTEELNQISGFQKNFGYSPNLVTDIYKNRRGRWNMVRIWSRIDLGTCRKYDLFITTNKTKPINDFLIMNLKSENEEAEKLVENYNRGKEIINLIELPPLPSMEETDIIDLGDAFGDVSDRLERIKGKDFDDFL